MNCATMVSTNNAMVQTIFSSTHARPSTTNPVTTVSIDNFLDLVFTRCTMEGPQAQIE